MALTRTEKNACSVMLQKIKTQYLDGTLTRNEMGLTSCDLNIPRSKITDTIQHLRGLPKADRIVSGAEGASHVIMYIVSGNPQHPHLDITGHQIVYKDGQRIDQTMKKGEGKAGAALFNVHVNFTGVSDEIKKQQAIQMVKSKEQQKVFAAKKKAEEARKVKVPTNPFELLGEEES